MKIFLLEILTLATVAMTVLPLAKTPKRDKDTLAHLENVGTFGM